MRDRLLAATALSLLAFSAAAQPVAPSRLAAPAVAQVDFDLLKQAEQQSLKDQAEAEAKKAEAAKAAEDAAKQAQANEAAAPPPPVAEPPKAPQPTRVAMKLSSGAAAGSAELSETPGGLRLVLGLANLPAGRYRLLVLPRPGCGKPAAAPAGVSESVPVVTAGADGAIAAAFTLRHQKSGAGGLALALYPEEAEAAGTPWIACGATR